MISAAWIYDKILWRNSCFFVSQDWKLLPNVHGKFWLLVENPKFLLIFSVSLNAPIKGVQLNVFEFSDFFFVSKSNAFRKSLFCLHYFQIAMILKKQSHKQKSVVLQQKPWWTAIVIDLFDIAPCIDFCWERLTLVCFFLPLLRDYLY